MHTTADAQPEVMSVDALLPSFTKRKCSRSLHTIRKHSTPKRQLDEADSQSMPELAQNRSQTNDDSISMLKSSPPSLIHPGLTKDQRHQQHTTPSPVDPPYSYEDEPPEIQLPPLFFPLTQTNLREHTARTNPGEGTLAVEMSNSGDSKASSLVTDSLTRLEAYGIVIGDHAPFPNSILQFLNNVMMHPRAHETP
ncbi:hypothetical protein OPT61_g1537 [Boeremia exigua]|uniref:Uncharacterized protein n=1 Tax=Boeremia exigua TaxID=749465 RepID=A0ACC2IPS3_9PLEO|nr:hypothetical protein OPT61_g1537 [Boeremia exigua]